MKRAQLAAQLYTLRDHCKTAADLAITARKVRAIGYPAVQVSGIGPIPDAEVARILASEGLTICATHEAPEVLLHEPQRAIDRLGALGCRLTAYPFPRDVDMTSFAAVTTLARQLDRSGAALRAAGITLSYHNHAHEFHRHDGATVLEHLFKLTRPENLSAELDTYWVQFGGGDPVSWCERMTGRLPGMHLKDFGVNAEHKPMFREIGQGNLEWHRILPAAERAGCQWFIVEQDVCPGDPFDSLKLSYDYLCSLATA